MPSRGRGNVIASMPVGLPPRCLFDKVSGRTDAPPPRPLPARDDLSADTPPRGGPRGCSARGEGVGREDRDVQWPQILSESPSEAIGKAESV